MCVIHKYFGTVEKTADIANVNRRKNVLLMEGLFGFSEKKTNMLSQCIETRRLATSTN